LENLDFDPHKSILDFRKNYKLHDLAEAFGKNLLVQWGIEFEEFGNDNRYSKVWEKGKDKPDLIITYKSKQALLDWKGKHKAAWLVNERAVLSYEEWKTKTKLEALVCFTVFNEDEKVVEARLAAVGKHPYKLSNKKEWDKNRTVEFEGELPLFTKANLLNLI